MIEQYFDFWVTANVHAAIIFALYGVANIMDPVKL